MQVVSKLMSMPLGIWTRLGRGSNGFPLLTWDGLEVAVSPFHAELLAALRALSVAVLKQWINVIVQRVTAKLSSPTFVFDRAIRFLV